MKVSPKILAVDDIPENLLLLCNLLEERGYNVHLASDGESVLKNIEESPPDLILLDIRLSGISGYQVCSALKANPATEHIPIIFLSVLEDPKVKVKAFQVGGNDYVTKPFQEEEVIARIENQLTIQRQKKELEGLQEELLEQNEILEEKNDRLKLLLNLTQVMNQAETIDEAIQPVINQLCQMIHWDYGEAWVLDTEENLLESDRYFYVSDSPLNHLNDQEKNIFFQAKNKLIEKIVTSKNTEWVDNVKDLAQFTSTCNYKNWQEKIQKIGLASLLGLPITFRGKVLAVLLFFLGTQNQQKRARKDLSLTLDEVELIKSVGSQLGTLMQRLRTEIALKKANERLQHLVAYDGLTEIANRRRFDEYLDEQWRQGKRNRGELSLILCDLDAFKLYNDHLGHQAGDECLKKVASVLQESVQRPMDLVARYGGEELAVLLPYTSQIGAFQLAEKIRVAVKELRLPHPHSPVSNFVTISVGVSSIIPRDDCSPKMLIRMADNALYEAKRMGRDQVILNNQSSEDSSSEVFS